jgi:undecaprenyl-diphosphatase
VLLLQAALLGIVQGLTEFLPVSSSAHLLLARMFFGWDAEQFGRPFDVACHVGTLVAILIYFRADLARLLAAVPRAVPPVKDVSARLLWLVAVATLPLIPMGLVLAGLEDSLRTPQVIVVTLAVVGVLMLVADRLGRRARRAEDLGYGEAFVLGVAQGLALIPGVSRSGATITTGLAFGLDRESAAKFSFLIGIPAMLAAAAHEGRHLLGHPMDAVTKEVFLIGIVASGVVGYATVKFFLRYLINHSLAAFAWYRIALAAVTLAWLIA